jgi:hypothetical protein
MYLVAKQIFPSHRILENYKHPIGEVEMRCTPMNYPMEFDVFIPGLNLALEYQGQQHYDEIPSFFNYLQSYQIVDTHKAELAKRCSITLVHIPYWWDHSSTSLQQTISKSLCK